MSCLVIDHLSVTYSQGTSPPVCAVDEVNLEHHSGETLALIGETGSGKTTLALALVKLLPKYASIRGTIRFNGRVLSGLPEKELVGIRGREIALVPQNPGLSLDPTKTVGSQIAEMYRHHLKQNRSDSFRQGEALLKRMGFTDSEQQMKLYPFQFSEGMNQRVLIAMAFALKPRLIVADEPTKGLDDHTKQIVLEELRWIKEQGSSLLMISHDLYAARSIADRIALMYGGQILESCRTGDFFSRPLHPYSRALLDSLPERGFHPIPGTLPSMINPSPGCRFEPRCRERKEICSREQPPNIQISGREVKCFLYQ